MATKFNADRYTLSSTTTDLFSDFTNNMEIHPGTGDLSRVRNDQAIIQSVRNLLMTDYNERRFAPYVGSRIRQLMFELMSPQTAVLIKTAIENTVKNYEPRVNLLETVVDPDEDNNGYYVRLKFSLINSSVPVELGFFLDRTR